MPRILLILIVAALCFAVGGVIGALIGGGICWIMKAPANNFPSRQ